MLKRLCAVKKSFNLRTFTTLILFAFCILLLTKPAYYIDSARRGLSLVFSTVLPSLFPFYFFSMLLTKIGAARVLSRMFEKPIFKLYRTPKESAYVMILSMISGYPVGASCIKELYLNGIIDKSDAKAMSAFCSTSGPVFMLGTLGTAIFDSVTVGVIIALSHYIAAFLNGFLYRKNTRNEDLRVIAQQSADNALSKSMSSATASMLIVGGYIVICGMIVDALALLRLDDFILATFGGAGQPILALIYGSVEMTRGGIECAKCAFRPLGVALAALIVSFGGLSVTFQNYTFLSSCNIKPSEVLTRKLTHSLIAFSLAFALSLAFKNYL